MRYFANSSAKRVSLRRSRYRLSPLSVIANSSAKRVSLRRVYVAQCRNNAPANSSAKRVSLRRNTENELNRMCEANSSAKRVSLRRIKNIMQAVQLCRKLLCKTSQFEAELICFAAKTGNGANSSAKRVSLRRSGMPDRSIFRIRQTWINISFQASNYAFADFFLPFANFFRICQTSKERIFNSIKIMAFILGLLNKNQIRSLNIE